MELISDVFVYFVGSYINNSCKSFAQIQCFILRKSNQFKCNFLSQISPPWPVFIRKIKLVDRPICSAEENAQWTKVAAEKK